MVFLRDLPFKMNCLGPGAADFKASQKQEFEHADFSGFARLIDAFCRSSLFQHMMPEEVTNPHKDFSSITMLYSICPDSCPSCGEFSSSSPAFGLVQADF